MEFHNHTDKELTEAYSRATQIVRRALEDCEAGKLDHDTYQECVKLHGDIAMELNRRAGR